MKLFTAILFGTLISITAFAAPPETESPLRKARLTGKIMRYGNDRLSKPTKGQLVCQFDTEIPVYGPWIPGQSKGRSIQLVAECNTTLKKRNVSFNVMSDMMLTEAKDGKPEGKKLTIFMTYFKNQKRDAVLTAETVIATGDREARRIGTAFTTPGRMRSEPKNYLSISAEAEDINQ